MHRGAEFGRCFDRGGRCVFLTVLFATVSFVSCVFVGCTDDRGAPCTDCTRTVDRVRSCGLFHAGFFGDLFCPWSEHRLVFFVVL